MEIIPPIGDPLKSHRHMLEPLWPLKKPHSTTQISLSGPNRKTGGKWYNYYTKVKKNKNSLL
jgi:hypothetical protein